MTTKRKTLTCLRCQHIWLSSNPTPPVTCPNCKRRDWNKKGVKKHIHKMQTQ